MTLQRINFIEGRKWDLTYRNIATLGLSWCGFLLVLALIQAGQFYYLQWRVKSLEKEITSLKSETVLVADKMTPMLKRQGPGYNSLYTLFEKRVQWSPFLTELARRTPPRLWLVEITSRSKDPKGPQRTLTLTGLTYQNSTLSGFLKELSGIKGLANVILFSSEKKEEEGLVHFTIQSDFSSL